jgi:hypothetical protein
LYVAEIEECMTFGQAYHRFPDLRGPLGPIHVEPINGVGRFPQSAYQHISGAMHASDWQTDLPSRRLDRFFVFRECDGWLGRWLGPSGPEVDDEIVEFLNTCTAFGAVGELGANTGTVSKPIAYGGLTTGLHLETDAPEALLALCRARMSDFDPDVERTPVPRHPGTCRRLSPPHPRRDRTGC